jgi:hypothetical protein
VTLAARDVLRRRNAATLRAARHEEFFWEELHVCVTIMSSHATVCIPRTDASLTRDLGKLIVAHLATMK